MNINLTILGEMITFAILVWVTMKYIWPPIKKAMTEREAKIADGLEAAERGKRSLELAQEKVKKQLHDAKGEAGKIIDQAQMRVTKMIEAAKEKANHEGKNILSLAQKDIATELEKAKIALKEDMANLVIVTAEKFLQSKLNAEQDRQLIDKLIEEI